MQTCYDNFRRSREFTLLAYKYDVVIIQLVATLQPNIGFTLRRVLAVFTRSALTPPKVNRFV